MTKFKLAILGVAVVACVLLGFVMWYTYPRQHSLQLQGIEYQLGDTHQGYVKPLMITINGTVERKLNGRRIFKGTLDIVDDEPSSTEDEKKVWINFDKKGQGTIFDYYAYRDSRSRFFLNTILADNDFEMFSILVHKKIKDGRSTWNSEDGMVISAPANNRDEALLLFKKLFRSIPSTH